MHFLNKALRFIAAVILLLNNYHVWAQFYNGSKLSFGKNRPRYNQFFWTYHSTKRFDVYYYQGGEELATFLSNFAPAEIERLESILNTKIDDKIVFIVFNRLSDLRQSNIGLVTGKEEYNLGGTTQIFRNKVSLFFETDIIAFEQQITASITELILRQFILQGSNQSFWEPNVQSGFPRWFIDGLRAYTAMGWSTYHDQSLQVISTRHKLSRFKSYRTEDDEIMVGQAFWLFFSQTFGLHSVSECLTYASFYDNHIKAIEEVAGKPFREVMADFEKFWEPRLAIFQSDSLKGFEHKAFIKAEGDKRILKFSLSPDANHLAWVESIKGKKRLWVKDVTTGKRKLIAKTGNKLNQIQDNSFPVFAWHPTSSALAYSIEYKGEILINIVDLISKEQGTRKLPNISKVLSLSYSPDAMSILFSAVVAGKTDILRYSIPENRIERVTNTLAFDHSPVFDDSGKRIAFVSNDLDRSSSDILLPSKNFDFNRSGESIWLTSGTNNTNSVKKLTHADYENIPDIKHIEKDRFSFTSDFTGVNQLRFGQVDSTVSHIDTAIHYNYLIRSHAVNLGFPVFYSSDINFDQQLAAVYAPEGNKDYVFVKSIETNELNVSNENKSSIWRKELEAGWKKLEERNENKLPEADTLLVEAILRENSPKNYDMLDIYSWVFEREKLNFHLSQKGFSPPLRHKETDRISKIGYNIVMFPDKLVNQIDFGFLNATYQPYTGTPGYFNPGLNLNFIVGAADLFEDYKLYGGLSLGSDIESTEYLIMFEYLGGVYKHQFAFHRQAYLDIQIETQHKVRSNEFFYYIRYPFSQVSSAGGGISTRFDRIIIPAVDLQTLTASDDHRIWSGLKVDYTFDNSTLLGFNLLEGVRLKVFAESQLGIGMGKRADLYTLGADFRGYVPLWRGSVLACRFAGGTSAGYAGLVYYLGSVDSWVNFNPLTANFDESVKVNNPEKLMFQTLATNLRGFPQNIRNGPSFVLINSELRIPLIKFISNRGTGSRTLNSLQVVGFFDAGSAWKGLTPWQGTNAWEQETITNGPITITFKTQRSPLVAGYGFGLRIQTLGYPLRFDYAWGIESGKVRSPIFYFSTSIDF